MPMTVPTIASQIGLTIICSHGTPEPDGAAAGLGAEATGVAGAGGGVGCAARTCHRERYGRRCPEGSHLHKDTHEARLRLLGPVHPDTMRSRHALALTYADLGRYDEAITLHELNLTERLRYLSPDHPHITDTIDAMEAARAAQPPATQPVSPG